MKRLEVLSKNIAKVLRPWVLEKNLIHSAYVSNLMNLTIQDEMVVLLYDDENIFIVEDYKDFYHVHGIFKNLKAVQDCFQILGKKSYLWSLEDLGNNQGSVTKYVLERKTKFHAVQALDQPTVKWECVIENIKHGLPAILSLAYKDLLKRSFQEKEIYGEVTGGRIKYLQSYLLHGRVYSGIYLYSEGSSSETISKFIKVHDSVDVDRYESWVVSWSESSQALHKLLGYQKTEQNFYLVTN